MIWDFLVGVFSSGTDTASSMHDISSSVVNPATGLPMLDTNAGGVDVGGSPYGMDLHGSMANLSSSLDTCHWD